MFPSVSAYYFGVIFDFVARFAWCLTLIPIHDFLPINETRALILNPILAIIEMMRRCYWACFRLEWEHLCLTQTYHNMYDSDAIVPMHIDQQEKLRVQQELRQLPLLKGKKRSAKSVILEILFMVILVIGMAIIIVTT